MISCIGDIHLDKLSHRIPKFPRLVEKTLRNTIDLSLKRGCEAIVFMGDIFDTPYPKTEDVLLFLNVLTDYKEDVDFKIILGNHDYSDIHINSLRTIGWVNKIKHNIEVIKQPTILKYSDVRYHVQPHPFCEDMNKKADFALGHFAVNGARGDNGFVVRTKNQPKGNWILGDFHGEQIIQIKKNIYEYVGSLSQLSWEEKNQKSFLTVEDGEKVRHKIPSKYKLVKYSVSSDDDLDACSFEKGNYYYVQTSNGYILPKGWAIEHPMVIRTSAVGVRKDARASVVLADKYQLSFTPLSFLEQYLVTKKVDERFIKRTMKIAHKIKVSAE